jgi:hypothetical protein
MPYCADAPMMWEKVMSPRMIQRKESRTGLGWDMIGVAV